MLVNIVVVSIVLVSIVLVSIVLVNIVLVSILLVNIVLVSILLMGVLLVSIVLVVVSVVLVSNDNVPARITGRPSAYHNPAAYLNCVYEVSIQCIMPLNRSTKFFKNAWEKAVA